jgi:hypothetical protein
MVDINFNFFFSHAFESNLKNPKKFCLFSSVISAFIIEFAAFIIYSYSLPFGAHEKEFFIDRTSSSAFDSRSSNRVSSSKPFLIIQSSDRRLGVARAKKVAATQNLLDIETTKRMF